MVQIGPFGILIDDKDGSNITIMTHPVQIICLVIGSISYFAGILVALSYILSKNLRSHPSFLVVMICICESIATFHMILGAFNVTGYIKSLRLHDALYYMLLGADVRTSSSSIMDLHERYAEILCESNNMLVNSFSLASIMFNICLCIDLLLTLRNPFSPPHGRNRWFVIGTAIISVSITVALKDYLKGPCRQDSSTEDKFQTRSS